MTHSGRLLGLALVVASVAVACGHSSPAATSASSTTARRSTTTTAASARSTTSTASTPTSTTVAAGDATTTTMPPGPVGDEKLVPLLLDPSDFGPGVAASSATDEQPSKTYCKGVDFTTTWHSSATMSVESSDQSQLVGANESILEFDAGRATRFMAEFSAVAKRCVSQDPTAAITLTPRAGVGDEAIEGASAATGTGSQASPPFEEALIRVGDQVIVLFAVSSATSPLLTDAVIAKAVADVKAG